jgi:hypothetical protein
MFGICFASNYIASTYVILLKILAIILLLLLLLLLLLYLHSYSDNWFYKTIIHPT